MEQKDMDLICSDAYGDSGIYSSSTHCMFPGGAHFFSGSFNYAVYKPL